MSDSTPEVIRNRARKNKLAAVLLGIFLPPLAYIYVGKWTWALVNFFTANYLIVGGLVIVPIHTYLSIGNARDEVGHAQEGF